MGTDPSNQKIKQHNQMKLFIALPLALVTGASATKWWKADIFFEKHAEKLASCYTDECPSANDGDVCHVPTTEEKRESDTEEAVSCHDCKTACKSEHPGNANRQARKSCKKACKTNGCKHARDQIKTLRGQGNNGCQNCKKRNCDNVILRACKNALSQECKRKCKPNHPSNQYDVDFCKDQCIET